LDKRDNLHVDLVVKGTEGNYRATPNRPTCNPHLESSLGVTVVDMDIGGEVKARSDLREERSELGSQDRAFARPGVRLDHTNQILSPLLKLVSIDTTKG
jgi:hypothetical protein